MGGGSTPRNTTQTTITQYPPWMATAMQNNLASANSLADRLTERGYQAYDVQDRIAGMNDLQFSALERARDSAGNWAPILQSGLDRNAQSADLAMEVAGRPMQDYSAQAAFAGPSGMAVAPSAQAAYAGPAAMSRAFDANAARIGQMQGWNATTGTAAQAGSAQTNRGDIRELKAATFANGLAPIPETAAKGGYWPGESAMRSGLSAYMNPYTDLVTKNALANLEEQRKVNNIANADAAFRAKAFGGSRHGVVEGMTNSGFAKQAGDLALNSAERNWNSAVDLMGRDIASDFASQQANAGYDAQVALGNTGFRQQSGLQNASMAQQMGLANMDAYNRAAQDWANANNTGTLTQGQFDQAANLQSHNALMQSQFANQNASNQMAQFNAGLAQQANMQNAQMGLQAQLANLSAYNQMAQFNAGLAQQANLQNAQLGQQGDLAMRNIGLSAADRLGAAGAADARMAEQFQGLNINDVNNLMTAGNTLQDQDQLERDFAYQEWLNAQNFPIDMLNLRYSAVQNTPYEPGRSITAPGPTRNRTAGFIGGATTGAATGYQVSGGNPWGALIGGVLGAYGGYSG